MVTKVNTANIIKFKCQKLANLNEKFIDRLFSEVAAIRAEDPNLFYKTHTKITLYDSNNESTLVDEDAIVEKMKKSYPKNHCIVIEGETGTGKSELCAYVGLKLKEAGYRVISIPKNYSLIDTIEKISSEMDLSLSTHTDLKDKIKKLKEDIDKYPNIISGKIIYDVLYELKYDDNNDSVKIMANKMQELLTLSLKNLINTSAAEIDRDVLIFEKEHFKNQNSKYLVLRDLLLYLKRRAKFNNDDEIIYEINKIIWKKIKNLYDMPRIDQMLDDIQNSLISEKRIIVIFEDFSITGLERKDLLDFIARDVPGDKFNFLIAGTTDRVGLIKEIKTAYDRFEFFRTNPTNKVEVAFLQPENAVNFITRYLNIIYEEYGSSCIKCNFCPNSKKINYQIFFPFTPEFLKNIFISLPAKKPRKYIQFVKILLLLSIQNNQLPIFNNDVINALKTPFLPREFIETLNDNERKIISWYGILNAKNSEIILPKFIYSFFKNDFRQNEGNLLIEEFNKHGINEIGFIRIRLKKSTKSSKAVRENEKLLTGQNIALQEPEWVIKEKQFSQYYDTWLSGTDTFHNEEISIINTAVENIIKKYFKQISENYAIFPNKTSLIFDLERISDAFIVVNEDYDFSPNFTNDFYKVKIPKKMITFKMLSSILRLYFAEKSELAEAKDDIKKLDHDCLKQLYPLISYLVERWRDRIHENLIFRTNDFSIYEFSATTVLLLLILEDPTIFTMEHSFEDVSIKGINSILNYIKDFYNNSKFKSQESFSPLFNLLNHNVKSKLSQFIELRRYYLELFFNLFMLNKNVIDFQTQTQILLDVFRNLDDYLQKISPRNKQKIYFASFSDKLGIKISNHFERISELYDRAARAKEELKRNKKELLDNSELEENLFVLYDLLLYSYEKLGKIKDLAKEIQNSGFFKNNKINYSLKVIADSDKKSWSSLIFWFYLVNADSNRKSTLSSISSIILNNNELFKSIWDIISFNISNVHKNLEKNNTAYPLSEFSRTILQNLKLLEHEYSSNSEKQDSQNVEATPIKMSDNDEYNLNDELFYKQLKRINELVNNWKIINVFNDITNELADLSLIIYDLVNFNVEDQVKECITLKLFQYLKISVISPIFFLDHENEIFDFKEEISKISRNLKNLHSSILNDKRNSFLVFSKIIMKKDKNLANELKNVNIMIKRHIESHYNFSDYLKDSPNDLNKQYDKLKDQCFSLKRIVEEVENKLEKELKEFNMNVQQKKLIIKLFKGNKLRYKELKQIETILNNLHITENIVVKLQLE